MHGSVDKDKVSRELASALIPAAFTFGQVDAFGSTLRVDWVHVGSQDLSSRSDVHDGAAGSHGERQPAQWARL